MNSNNKSHPNPVDWWKHRRWQAYASLVWILLQTFIWIGLAIIKPSTLPLLYSVIGFSYSIPAAVVTAYYGAATFGDYLDKPPQRTHQRDKGVYHADDY